MSGQLARILSDHWLRACVIGMLIVSTVALVVGIPLHFNGTLLCFIAATTIVLYLLVGACYFNRALTVPITLVHISFRFTLVIFSLLFVAYVATSVAGYLDGTALPAAYLFQLWPVAESFNQFEPHFPLIIILAALLTTALSWLCCRNSVGGGAIRRQEAQSIRTWRWLGLTAIFGMYFVFIASGAWSGNATYRDLPYLNVVGLAPNSDARGYFDGARYFLFSGTIDSWNLRRPLATFFRAITVIFGEYNYIGTILTQITLVSIATYISTSYIIKWRGFSAGMVFLAMSFIMTRDFLPSTMTESLSLFWAFLALPLVVHGLQRSSVAHIAAGFGMIVVALFIRMGPMFVIPAVICWIFLFFGDDLKEKTRNAIVGCLVAGGVFLSNFVISKMFGAPGAQLGGNYAQTLCGMSIGGLWGDCLRKYANEITALTTEDAQATFFYKIALQNILNDPHTFLGSMWIALSRFLSDLPALPVTWYRWPQQTYFPVLGLYALAVMGWIYIIHRRVKADQIAFCALFALGILASVPLIYFEDAQRVLIPVYPIWALTIAGGVFAPVTLRVHRYHRISLLRWGLAAIAGVVLILLALVALRWQHPEYQIWAHEENKLASDERIIAGRELQSGVIVLADSAVRLDDVPSMGITQFLEFLHAANIDPSAGALPIPETPFGFVSTYEWAVRAYSTYFVSPDIMRNKSARRWKVKVRMLNQSENWVNVEAATPLP